VALYWLRLFKPLIDADLPQTPTNRGTQGLGFVGAGFRALGGLSHLDLRIGCRFGGDTALALHQALREASDTITKMPAFYMTYPGGGQIMKARRSARLSREAAVVLEEPYLRAFGELLIPIHIWRALARFDAWIEPALVAEWLRLMKSYGERQGRQLEDHLIARGMVWSEPMREVAVARQRAVDLIHSDGKVFCVWSGKKLTSAVLDIDHCLPWAAWPCGDLWNLLPAHRSVNQHEKRNRLPSAERLRDAQATIEEWWQIAYVKVPTRTLVDRFFAEARASLPTLSTISEPPSIEDVFAALALKRLALKQDQEVPEWGA
jgi:hypothetical protein